jgi:anti-anti-sigma regulatory factor
MTVQVRPIDGGRAVRGELDLAAADDFRKFAASVVDPMREVILDIADVAFMIRPGSKQSCD